MVQKIKRNLDQRKFTGLNISYMLYNPSTQLMYFEWYMNELHQHLRIKQR
jgi:hypothetical protein